MFNFTNYKALCGELEGDVERYKAFIRLLQIDFDESAASCLELQGIIDDVTNQNTVLSNKLATQKTLIAELKKELADKQIWTTHLVEQNKELNNTLSTWRSKAKIALDNYTREVEKC